MQLTTLQSSSSSSELMLFLYFIILTLEVGWLVVVLMWLCDAVNPSLPESDLQILLCLTPDGFTRQREIPWGLKGFIVSIVIRLNFTLTVCLVDVYYFE